MDAATLQQKIYQGYAKAALRIGYMTDVYRPVNAFNPLSLGNKITSINASFNAESMTYNRPNKYAHPTWFGVFDGSKTKVGDILTNAQDGTYYVAAQQTALPILLVQTNRTINVLRPQQQTGVGAVNYNGDTVATETQIMTGWPASVLIGTKGEKSQVSLPGDTRSPWWAILMPAVPGVNIRHGDILTDDLNRRYVCASVELTDLGYRMTAEQSVA